MANTSFENDEYPTSAINEDGVIYHDQDSGYVTYYQYECGKSFVEICHDMGLDSDPNITIKY